MGLSSYRPQSSGAVFLSRREMLARAGLGFGAWALLDLLERDRLRAAEAVRFVAREEQRLRAVRPHELAQRRLIHGAHV